MDGVRPAEKSVLDVDIWVWDESEILRENPHFIFQFRISAFRITLEDTAQGQNKQTEWDLCSSPVCSIFHGLDRKHRKQRIMMEMSDRNVLGEDRRSPFFFSQAPHG